MTPSDLRRIGEALYGKEWQTQLAEALKVNPRNLRYWLAGRHGMPEGIKDDLKKIVAERRHALNQIAVWLRLSHS